MSESAATAGHAPARPALGVFERFLAVWVALCIIIGIALGQIIPRVFHVLGNATVAQVNLPVAVLVCRAEAAQDRSRRGWESAQGPW